MRLLIATCLCLTATAACGDVIHHRSAGGGGDGGFAGSSAGGGGFDADAACAPAAGTSHQLTVSFLEHEFPIAGDLTVPCTVSTVTEGEPLQLTLSCSEQSPSDLHMDVSLGNVPGDFAVPLAQGDEVQIDYHHRQAGHHIEPGTWLIVHDASGSSLLLAAIDDDGLAANTKGIADAGARIAPLSLHVDESICPASCTVDGMPCYEPRRHALQLTGADGAEAVVHDAERGELVTGGARYDVAVGMARSYSALNVGNSFQILIGAQP